MMYIFNLMMMMIIRWSTNIRYPFLVSYQNNEIYIFRWILIFSNHLLLTHSGRVTHICVNKLTIIGSDIGLLPGRHQDIIWTKAGILLIRTSGENFSEILKAKCIHFHSRKCIWNVVCKMAAVLYRVKSLWPGDAIWRHGTRSTLAQVMTCCLTAPSHYLDQCWLVIVEVPWHSSQGIILRRCEDTNQQNEIENCSFKMTSKSPRDQWVLIFKSLWVSDAIRCHRTESSSVITKWRIAWSNAVISSIRLLRNEPQRNLDIKKHARKWTSTWTYPLHTAHHAQGVKKAEGPGSFPSCQWLLYFLLGTRCF